MGSCKEVSTPGVKEVSTSPEPAWFERTRKEEHEEWKELVKDPTSGRAGTGTTPKKEFSRDEGLQVRSCSL